MGDNKRPLGRHELTEEEKARLRAEAEARYREEVEAELRQRQGAPSAAPEEGPPGAAPAKPKSAGQIAAEKEAARRAALTPEERAREDRKNRIGCLVFTIVMIPVALIILRSCGGAYLQSRAAEKAQREAAAARALTLEGQDPYLIREACLTSVRNKLKSPTSAKFYDDALPSYSGSAWNWSSYVDAQNSFGAMIRTPFLCTVTGTTADDARVQTVLLD
ncbi:hypothetical protein [Deinococcus geothermalis]|uniref:hypothetical protein n=1 Tax=Deinococcus geothermalis TaxID=68909 RepID=UPI002352FBC3|nr:hypothetical protein [Deinococcus geothermalis]